MQKQETAVGRTAGRSPAPAGDEQSPEKIRAMFALISPVYDRLNHLFSGQLDRRWRRLAARAAVSGLRPGAADGLRPGAADGLRPGTADGGWRLVDVATGTGDLARALAREAGLTDEGAGGHVIGADFTRPMLARAGEKYGRGAFRWVEADGLRLPLADGAADACTIGFGLRNMVDREGGLAEMARVVRPGGRVAILEFSRPRSWIVRKTYDFYAYRVMPRVGAWLSRSDAYLYLADSIRGFWDAEALSEKMRAVGLTEVRFRSLMFGVVCLHVGVKS
jgi:demethylmenaquinone methyltransferase/2-methoxy-6-polyprenyl-1,4-benzoquinol methylase